MADVEILTVSSRVDVHDSAAMLNPQIVEQFVQLAVSRFKHILQHESDTKEEQRMRPSMTSRPTAHWE